MIKHFFADYVWQSKRMLSEKGTYLATGGLQHAAVHGLLSFLIMYGINPELALVIGIFDALVHYHVDWVKVRLSRGLDHSDPKFWFWFGVDQTLHMLTYIAIVAWWLFTLDF